MNPVLLKTGKSFWGGLFIGCYIGGAIISLKQSQEKTFKYKLIDAHEEGSRRAIYGLTWPLYVISVPMTVFFYNPIKNFWR